MIPRNKGLVELFGITKKETIKKNRTKKITFSVKNKIIKFIYFKKENKYYFFHKKLTQKFFLFSFS